MPGLCFSAQKTMPSFHVWLWLLSAQMSGQDAHVLQMCCSDAYVWLLRLSAQNPGIYSITRVMACSKVIYKQRYLLLSLPIKN